MVSDSRELMEGKVERSWYAGGWRNSGNGGNRG